MSLGHWLLVVTGLRNAAVNFLCCQAIGGKADGGPLWNAFDYQTQPQTLLRLLKVWVWGLKLALVQVKDDLALV